MRKVVLVIFPVVVLGVLVAGTYFWWLSNTKPVTDQKALQNFSIPRGVAAVSVGSKLAEEGLVRSALAFKLYVQLTDKAGQIKPGEYRLSPDLTLGEIVERLVNGPAEVWVTIPEGLRREEVVKRFVDGLGTVDSADFTGEFLAITEDEEGYLFPDTYLFAKDVKVKTVVDKLTSTFDKKVDAQMKADISSSGKNLREVVIMASLVERETKSDEERPVVAGILYKRLKIGMPLQVDATIQYVLSSAKCKAQSTECDWWPTVYREDYKIKSPFNTYLNIGLPPAPIANPGLSSISAAIYPENSPYLFYLHGKEGKIHYAKNLEEHNQNAGKYIGS